jgi:hypothetical protein
MSGSTVFSVGALTAITHQRIDIIIDRELRSCLLALFKKGCYIRCFLCGRQGIVAHMWLAIDIFAEHRKKL